MSEQPDNDLRTAIREGTVRTLQGWEFTPEMRREVLDRLHTVAPGAAPSEGRPARRLIPPAFRPLIWVAAAAAGVVFATNLDLGGLGSGGKEQSADAPMAMSAAPAIPAPSPAPAPSTAPAQSPTPAPDAYSRSALPGSTATSQAESGAAEFSITAKDAVPPRTIELADGPRGVDQRSAPPPRLAAPMAPASAASPDLKVTLTAVATDRGVVVVGLSSVRVLDQGGNLVREQPVNGITNQSLLAVANDGKLAVAAGDQVLILSSSGEIERTMDLRSPASLLAWSKDRRLAVGNGSAVTVYRNGEAQYRVEGVEGAQAAFGPDGTLAVSGHFRSGRMLALFTPEGRRQWEVPAAGTGKGMAFSPDGAVIVAGGAGYDRSGNLRWQLELQPDGIVWLGGSGVLAGWDSRQVMALRAETGAVLWQAVLSGDGQTIQSVTSSSDGALIAVVASSPAGGAVWVLDQAGTIRHTEALEASTAGAALTADRLILLLPEGAQVREIGK